MTLSDDEDESLAQFLESEFLSEVSDQEETCPEVSKAKRLCVENEVDKLCSSSLTGLFRNVFKFLSSEDLIACSMVCRFMNIAVSDECLWCRLFVEPTHRIRKLISPLSKATQTNITALALNDNTLMIQVKSVPQIQRADDFPD